MHGAGLALLLSVSPCFGPAMPNKLKICNRAVLTANLTFSPPGRVRVIFLVVVQVVVSARVRVVVVLLGEPGHPGRALLHGLRLPEQELSKVPSRDAL